MLRLGFVTEENLKTVLELNYGVKYLDLKKVTADPALVSLLPQKFALRYGLVPVHSAGNRLTLAMVDPTDDESLSKAKEYLNDWHLSVVVCTDDGFQNFIRRAYNPTEAIPESVPTEPVLESVPTEAIPESVPAGPVPESVLEPLPESSPKMSRKDAFKSAFKSALKAAPKLRPEPVLEPEPELISEPEPVPESPAKASPKITPKSSSKSVVQPPSAAVPKFTPRPFPIPKLGSMPVPQFISEPEPQAQPFEEFVDESIKEPVEEPLDESVQTAAKQTNFVDLVDDSGTQYISLEDQLGQGVDENRTMVLLSHHIISNAISKGCTNIHIEPNDRQVLVHYRKEGVLFAARKLPRSILPDLVQRFKVMAAQAADEVVLPYDGVLNVRHGQTNFSFRLSIIPGAFGEHLVIWLG